MHDPPSGLKQTTVTLKGFNLRKHVMKMLCGDIVTRATCSISQSLSVVHKAGQTSSPNLF